MKLQMERNITTQHIFNALKPLTATGILPLSFTKETTSPQFWDFIERIEHFTEYATLEELQQFNKNMKAFSNIIENMKTGNITQNKSELFNTKNESFSKQMFANTQLLIEGKTIGKNADLNLFSIIFSHCLPLSGE
ncbi:MAG: hypothetical protein LBG59_07780 [Candidatus Peribacteria bacterium]|jgi:hypothetical protein|nr:hypothetical protein [Candidatus Peribacteria bacterium]